MSTDDEHIAALKRYYAREIWIPASFGAVHAALIAHSPAIQELTHTSIRCSEVTPGFTVCDFRDDAIGPEAWGDLGQIKLRELGNDRCGLSWTKPPKVYFSSVSMTPDDAEIRNLALTEPHLLCQIQLQHIAGISPTDPRFSTPTDVFSRKEVQQWSVVRALLDCLNADGIWPHGRPSGLGDWIMRLSREAPHSLNSENITTGTLRGKAPHKTIHNQMTREAIRPVVPAIFGHWLEDSIQQLRLERIDYGNGYFELVQARRLGNFDSWVIEAQWYKSGWQPSSCILVEYDLGRMADEPEHEPPRCVVRSTCLFDVPTLLGKLEVEIEQNWPAEKLDQSMQLAGLGEESSGETNLETTSALDEFAPPPAGIGRIHYKDYNAKTAKDIGDAFPKARELCEAEGGSWRVRYIVKALNTLAPETVSRYLRVFRAEKISPHGIEVPPPHA